MTLSGNELKRIPIFEIFPICWLLKGTLHLEDMQATFEWETISCHLHTLPIKTLLRTIFDLQP